MNVDRVLFYHRCWRANTLCHAYADPTWSFLCKHAFLHRMELSMCTQKQKHGSCLPQGEELPRQGMLAGVRFTTLTLRFELLLSPEFHLGSSLETASVDVRLDLPNHHERVLSQGVHNMQCDLAAVLRCRSRWWWCCEARANSPASGTSRQGL